jgi:nicotinate phosphoribosyltransferase
MISALATDLYELTMAAGYWRAGLLEPATFELFVRRLPPRRSYLVAAGLDDALAYLQGLEFTDGERAWLGALPQFAQVPRAFFDDYLRTFRFTGQVWAIPEGTPVFAGEPLLRVRAPLPEAQVVETALLAIVGFQTSVAAKAARIVDAAEGRPVIEFGARRAHGLGASLAAARAAFIGGCAGTSLVEAARRYGIPASGTMAHSWVQSFPSETAAFREFSRSFEAFAVYLLDTYDTIAATRVLIASGLKPPMVRLDSGDLVALGREVRAMLDRAGLSATKIFATGDLDEDRIAELLAAGAPLDGFGVGTMLSTVADAPALSAVYKLVQLERQHQQVDVIKLSSGKETWPEPKQVWRVIEDGRAIRDVVTVADEPPIPDATPLLMPVMQGGKRLEPSPPLDALQERCRQGLAMLPPLVRAITARATLPVILSERLAASRPSAGGRAGT